MNGRRPLLASFLTAFAVVNGACSPSEDVIAQVGERSVRSPVFQDYLEAVTNESWQAVEERVATRLLDQYLTQELVAAAAVAKLGEPMQPSPDQRLADIRLLVDKLCGPPPPIDQDKLEEEVRRRMTREEPARAHARQMLLSTYEEATKVCQRLKNGEDFVEISRELSHAANAQSGGELGMVVQGTLPESMDEVIFSLKAGEVSKPVQGPAGYHVFQVHEVIPRGTPHRPQVEAEVRRQLTEEQSRAHMSACVTLLSREIGVKVYQQHLWFTYHGRFLEEERHGPH